MIKELDLQKLSTQFDMFHFETNPQIHKIGEPKLGIIPVSVFRRLLFENIIGYVAQDKWRERGGFLIGTKHRKGKKEIVLITDFTAVEDAENKYDEMTFRRADFERITKELKKPLQIVGDFHSHPNQRLFPSLEDLENRFITSPWYISLIVNPHFDSTRYILQDSIMLAFTEYKIIDGRLRTNEGYYIIYENLTT